ncbi:Alpha/Beta hydrolase protein, partial [Lentinula lateritia]
GNLRFCAPQPPAPTSGVQLADTEPPECVQGIHTPGNHISMTTSLPTVVWIHGGGYFAGNASWYQGSDLLQQANNKVVAVMIQYRLGLFG